MSARVNYQDLGTKYPQKITVGDVHEYEPGYKVPDVSEIPDVPNIPDAPTATGNYKLKVDTNGASWDAIT